MAERPESQTRQLEAARSAFERRAWRDAFEGFRHVDELAALAPDDLWPYSFSATLCGELASHLALLERIYHELSATAPANAARAAFWLGFRLVHLGEPSRASGWLARAERLVEKAGPCVEQGYLELPRVRRHFQARQYGEALQAATRAAEAGERFSDPELATFARNLQGRILIRQGALEAGLRLHDEAMLAVTGGEVSAAISGLVYCSAIDSCSGVLAVDRVREWTNSLDAWCRAQPQLHAFTGECRVRRAEVMQLAGRWHDALGEAEQAALQLQSFGVSATGEAIYVQGEIQRLLGDPESAEERYRQASQAGRDPQPGLALLRLAQGRTDLALQALRSACAAATEPQQRVRLLPAYIDVAVAAGAADEAASAAAELERIADVFGTELGRALAAHGRAEVELATGNAAAALGSSRRAVELLTALDAPYLAAKSRLLVACSCQALDDVDGAMLESAAARAAFVQLGASADVAAIDALIARGSAAPAGAGGLSARELEVLRLVAAGKTNKLIGRELCLSEKTIDRHVSNILAKLGVPTRAGATAFAYEHKLL